LQINRSKFLLFKISTAAGRALFSFLIPGGLILLIAFLLTREPIVEALPGLSRIYPLIVLVAGLFIGWRFNRSQLVFVILVLALADWPLLHFAAEKAASVSVGRTLYNAISFLLPLNLVYFSMMKERGIVTRDGLRRLSLIAAQVFVAAVICNYPKLGFAVYLEHSFFDWPLLSKFPLAQPALFAFGIAFLLLLTRYFQYRGVIDCGFFWALVSSFLALVTDRIGPVSTIYFSTAGLVLIISVIETSYGRAFRDELTGLPARRALNETLSKLGRHYTVAMVDIDFFKKLNDRYGHHVGDQVLRMIASKLENVANGSKAYRYGGEEFIVIFPDKSMDEVIPHLEGLRKAIKSSDFIVREQERRLKNPKKTKTSRNKTTVTISIGVAERDERNSTPQQVVKAADKALYRAKKKGRNRISK
jgi:diguanylate cyclase (GGDEF)-like protein